MPLNGNPFLGSYLSFGNFHLFNRTLSVTRRKVINRLLELVFFMNAFKMLIIVCAAWSGHLDVKLFLIEMYLFEEYFQKMVDIGILGMHTGAFFGFTNWIGLNERSLKAYRFLLIPDTNDRYLHGKRVQLDPQSTDRFLALYRIACNCKKLLIASYSVFALLMISRCLYHSFHRVSLLGFLSVAVPFGVFSMIAYLVFILFIFSKFVLVILSTAFLVLRLKAIDQLLRDAFAKGISIGRPVKVRKAKIDKALFLLADFCEQFKEINFVLDSSFSLFLFGTYLSLCILPYYLMFVEKSLAIQLFFGFLAIALYLFCFSFSLCNDRLTSNV